jgi:glucose-1-phosphate cytidylyltransferase
MQVVILAGGLGTRFSEETETKPKPMIEVGGKPILWHVMKWYSNFGFRDFIICCGYKGHIIKDYFANYYRQNSDVTYHLAKGIEITNNNKTENWVVTCVDTGENTMTGGRIKRIKEYIDASGEDNFLFTYGDGVGNIDIFNTLRLFQLFGKKLLLTAAKHNARFGVLDINDKGTLNSFKEKSQEEEPWVNAGFFVASKDIFNYIENDSDIWEQEPLQKLIAENEVCTYKHNGFWKPMDMLRDKMELEEMWKKKGNIYGE